MARYLVTAPAREPIILQQAKDHCRVDGSADDARLDLLIQAARQSMEGYLDRALIAQTWEIKRDAFPACGEIVLPLPPLQAVTHVKYIDTAGLEQTLSPSLYTVDAPSGDTALEGRVILNYGEVWPSTRNQPNAVTVRFVCGYGAGSEAVPAMIRAGLLLMIEDLYSNPGKQILTDAKLVENSAFEDHLFKYRIIRF